MKGRLGFVLLRIAVGKNELARGTEAIDTLRELIADTAARHPGVKIGLTGLPVMENDEMRASQSSMTWGGVVSFIGVVIVVVAGFGGLRHALLANIVLLIGTAWAFGYATLAVGHLNIIEHYVYRHAGGRGDRLRDVLRLSIYAVAADGGQAAIRP